MKKALMTITCMVWMHTLFGQACHWSPIEGNQDNATMTAVLYVNGEEQFLDYVEIGVFCGDECRASALPYEVGDQQLFFLTIKGNTNDLITFRLWDHHADVELDYECQNTYSFVVDDILGEWPDWYRIDFTSAVTQTIMLSAGWNWFSTYIEIDPVDLLDAMEMALGENGLEIKYKNTVTAWDDSEEEWGGDLQSIGLSNGSTYMVRTSAACSVTLVGPAAKPSDYPITLTPKAWTWIGFPCGVEVDIEDAFANFAPVDGDQIKAKGATAAWDEEEEEWSSTDMTKLVPGTGYMFYSNSTEVRTLIFQTGAKAR